MLSLRFPAHMLACLVLAAATLLAPAAATANRAGGRSPAAPRGLPLAHLLAGSPPAVYPPADPSRPLVTFPATENPNAVAVDPRTGHIFLLIPPPGDQVLHGTYPAPGPGTLATYDERSGALVRTIATPSGTGKLLLDGPRNRLYVITSTIQVVDTRTGALLRTIPVPSSAAAIDPASGHLLLATSAYAARLPRSAGPDGALIALDAMAPLTPTVIFATRLSNDPLDALGVDPLHGRIYVADAGPLTQPGEQCVPGHCTSSVYTLDSATGRLLAAVPLHNTGEGAGFFPEHATCLAVAPEADRVVVTETAGGRSTGEARVLDARTGALLSTSGTGYDPCVEAVDQRSGLAFIAEGPSYDDRQPQGGVQILDVLRGVFVAGRYSPARYPSAVLADPGTHTVDVLWASYSQPPAGLPPGVLMVLDARTGAEVREVPLAANPLDAALSPRRGGLIALNRPALLPGNAHEPVVGTSSLTTIPAAARAPGIVPLHHQPGRIAVDPLTHRAFVVAAGLATAPDRPATGLVDVLDTATGALLRTVPVGITPSSIALDAAAGKVYVLNAGVGDRVPPSVSILSATDGTPLAVVGIRAFVPYQPPDLYALSGHLYLIGTPIDAPPGQSSTAVETRDGDSGALLSRRIVQGNVRSVSADAGRGHLWVALDLIPRGVNLLDIASGASLRISQAAADALAVDPASGHLYLPMPFGLYLPTPHGPRLGIVETSPSGASIRTITLPAAPSPNGYAPQVLAMAADGASRRLLVLTRPGAALAGAPLPATLWLVDADTGLVLGVRPLDVAPSGLAIDAGSGHTFVPDAGGTVQIFDTRSGTPLATATTEPGSGPLAIDPASGHILVVNTAADSLSILDAKSGAPLPLYPAFPPPAAPASPVEVELPALSSATTQAMRGADGLVHLRRYLLPIGAIGAHGWQPRSPAFRTIVPGTAFAAAGLPFAARVVVPASKSFPEVTLASEAGIVLGVTPVAAAGLGPTSPAYGGLARDGSVSFRSELAAGGTTASGARRRSLGLQVWPTVRGITLRFNLSDTDPSSTGATLRLMLPRGGRVAAGPRGALVVERTRATSDRPDFILGPAIAGDMSGTGSWLLPGKDEGPVGLSLASGAGGAPLLTLQVDRAWLARHRSWSIFLPISTGQSAAESGSAASLERCPAVQSTLPGQLLVGRQGTCVVRGLLSFPIPALPAGATLQNATLHLSSPILAGPTGIAAYPALASSLPAGGLLSLGGGPSPETATVAVAEQQGADATGEHRWDLTSAIGPWLRGPAPGTVIVGLQGDSAPLGFFTGQELPTTDPADIPYLEITYRPRAL